jgi:hypothetical protein
MKKEARRKRENLGGRNENLNSFLDNRQNETKENIMNEEKMSEI